MKSKKYVIFCLAFTLLMASLAVGCAPARRPIENDRAPNLNQNDRMMNPGIEPYPGQMPRADEEPLADDGILREPEMDLPMRRQLEDRIAQEVERIPGVNSAVAIVNGNTAYVGIDAGKNIIGQAGNNLEDQVISRVRGIDTRITRVFVSTEMDVNERLRGFGRDIRGGRPAAEFINEIEELFRRPLPRT